MENVFLADLKPHEVYDLKGSWVGRQTNHGIEKGKIMKDNDLKRFIILSKGNRRQILNQLKRDTVCFVHHCIPPFDGLFIFYVVSAVCSRSDFWKVIVLSITVCYWVYII